MTDFEPIAVVGMAGVFPDAADLDAFWTLIRDRRSASAPSPPDRWIVPPSSVVQSEPAPDKAFSDRACLVKDFPFDPTGFALDADLLRPLDPLYHLTLHVGRAAVSGCRMESVDPARVNVTLAAIALPTDSSSRLTRELFGRAFAERLLGEGAEGTPAFTLADKLSARVTSLPAALLARAFGFGGGSMTLDAACASSLYAVKLACDALRAGRADAVVAGGVSRPECLYTQIGFSQLRALSPSGRCAPFDAGADGLVVGEGAGILVLKRLSDARAHGDAVHGIIRAVGLSNDMRGNLLSPEVDGQVRAMGAAYAAAGWTPDQVDHVECHGTGTPVGDGIELKSLHQIREGTPGELGGTPIGSVKSNVGHLLTGAGAAGLIKTLLALRHQTLPPSANFREAAENSPLRSGPFRVQTEVAPWDEPADRPRRAAVSAFGFGGINAHLLVEEFREPVRAPARRNRVPVPPPEPIAIVGIDVRVGPLDGVREFQEALFTGRTAFVPRPAERWHGADGLAGRVLDGAGVRSSERFGESSAQNPPKSPFKKGGLPDDSPPFSKGGPGGISPGLAATPDEIPSTLANCGAYREKISIRPGEFGVPPREIPDILPQQLLMLQAAGGALKDAGISGREPRPNAGVIVGMDFDPEACGFHLRWSLENRLDEWRERTGADQTADGDWLAELRDACGPPLTATRTLGALGGVVASRVAREFRLGGPSYTVSAEAAGGLRALEIAVRSLQARETDLYIAGAVDLAGDLRHVAATGLHPYGNGDGVKPFDQSANGALPGDGAAALVLKRLSDAKAAGDRVYAVIRGLGFAGGDDIAPSAPDTDVYARSLSIALRDAAAAPETVGLVAAHGSGDPAEDAAEAAALRAVLGEGEEARVAMSSAASIAGSSGAAGGMISVASAALSLFQEIFPPVSGFADPADAFREAGRFHIPAHPSHWYRDREDGPRRALAAAMTRDGNVGHVVLEGVEPSGSSVEPALIDRERRRPLGEGPAALFVVAGGDAESLSRGLSDLENHLRAPRSLDAAARAWRRENGKAGEDQPLALALVLRGRERIDRWLAEARRALADGVPRKIIGPEGIAFFPKPLWPEGEIAFVFPGSGSHYLGMGRGVGVRWPEVVRSLDAETAHLRSQALPELYVPWRRDWTEGWQAEAERRIVSDPVYMLFGQVFHGSLMARLVNSFGVHPDAVIGYSLGETAGYFATGAWTGRGEMLRRMRETDLFKDILHGRCEAARTAWCVPPDADFEWRVAVFNRPAEAVRSHLPRHPRTRLLIVNTPEECVVGGDAVQVGALARELNVSPIDLEGVTTVHCDAARPAAEAYRALHLFPTTPPPGIRYYSVAHGEARELTRESAADSILRQATRGFDFSRTVERAYADGVRVFLEMGPHSSCKRMIDRILGDRPHSALSACVRGEEDYVTVLKFLGNLIAERAPVDLGRLYGDASYPPEVETAKANEKLSPIVVPVGGPAPEPPLPPGGAVPDPIPNLVDSTFETNADEDSDVVSSAFPGEPPIPGGASEMDAVETFSGFQESARMDDFQMKKAGSNPRMVFRELVSGQEKAMEATARAHDQFLDFSDDLTRGYGEAFGLQSRLVEEMVARGGLEGDPSTEKIPPGPPLEKGGESESPPFVKGDLGGFSADEIPSPAFPREMCMEFAIGSAEKVLGPEFAALDTFPARVRLPDEPLMLVDRILSVEGQKGGMGSGRVVTEHDVFENAWYLDGGRAPVCISVEAGQADLFLCSYLGIDLQVKGSRTYRLLDATVHFHRPLPRPGEIIRYDIRIDRFIRTGRTWMFFFEFDGTINGEPMITMRKGCAGFFTEEEVKNSGGIILTEAERNVPPGTVEAPELVPMARESYDENAVDALRRGDLAGAFGPAFSGARAAESLRLPGGRMRLIHRVLELDPAGGRFGVGIVRAEADIQPDDWFLTCHFVDDMVMPGTLMYECCAHTLRVFLQRMGWVVDRVGPGYEPVLGVRSILKCRGPVTPETRSVIYEVELKKIAFDPEPHVIADANMYADGRPIVRFVDMGMRLAGVSGEELVGFWGGRIQKGEVRNRELEVGSQKSEVGSQEQGVGIQKPNGSGGKISLGEPREADSQQGEQVPGESLPVSVETPRFTREQLLAFCEGNPSDCFGEPYRVFDQERRIARLPRPPYFFMDRVVSTEPEPWAFKPGGWIESEYQVPPDAWYFAADRSGVMPYCVLLEIALQPCGFLAAYVGSALRSNQDLKFRNLGGEATLHRNLHPGCGTLTVRCRMTKASEAGGMIIENFDMVVLEDGEPVYEGTTYFGFFTEQALANQVGLTGADAKAYVPDEAEATRGRAFDLEVVAPMEPVNDALVSLGEKIPPGPPLEKGGEQLHPVNDALVSMVDQGIPTGSLFGKGGGQGESYFGPLSMPARALLNVDRIALYVPDGGPKGLGFVRGVKEVEPAEWFFQAHFYQDPVMPGSLGIEAFIQLLRFAALQRWPQLAETHRFEILTEDPQTWVYRGQIIQRNRRMTVEASITDIADGDEPVLRAEGRLLADGLPIYAMRNFGVRLVRAGQ